MSPPSTLLINLIENLSWHLEGAQVKRGKAEYTKLARMSLLAKDKSPELPRRCLSIPVKIREKS
jgi:hypothetical protein